MKKFNVTITISYQLEVAAADKNDAEEFAWERFMDNPTRHADTLVEEIDEEEE